MSYKWDIIGHARQLVQLEKELAEGNISHAYLFSGPADVGKFNIVRTFAGILLCDAGFCRSCDSCKRVKAGTHPDVLMMKDDGEAVKIDEVRDLIHKTSLTSQGGRRFVLIENVERMPVEAQNSFLKTLEEPPGDTVFLLTSSQISQVADTIKSRTRRLSFSGIDNALIREALTKRFGESSDMDEVLHMAQGRPGLAIRLLSDGSVLARHRQMYHQIDSFLSRNDLSAKFRFAEEADKDTETLNFFFDASFRFLRKVLHDYLTEQDPPLRNRFSLEEIANLFESLTKTRYLIKRNINKKLALENFFLQTER